MTPRRFSALAGLALLLLLAANLAIQRLTKNSPARQIMAFTAQKHPAANLAVLGNSLMVAGIRPGQLDAARGQPTGSSLNAALGGSTALCHLLLQRSLLANNPGIKTIVYGYMDFQLTDGASLDWVKAIGNESVILHLEPELVGRHLRMGSAEAALFHAARSLPMFVERGGVWGRVEVLRRRLGGLGMPAAASNSFGRVEDFAEMENNALVRFSAQAREHADNLEHKSALLNDMIASAQAGGARLLFVLMPMPSQHRRLYATLEWKNYQAGVHRLLREKKAGILDASGWVADDSLFIDPLHLGPDGAALFSRKLAEHLERPDEP